MSDRRPALTVQQVVKETAKQLQNTIRPLDQRWFEAELLVAHVLKQDRTWVALHTDALVTQNQLHRIATLAERRATHEPLAYLLGRAPFADLDFQVDARALIPRPESEWLVTQAQQLVGSDPTCWLVVDVGTGSGCLAISIKRTVPFAEVVASDLSGDALTLAKRNAKQLNAHVTFVKGTLLHSRLRSIIKQASKSHWLFVANLPYLPMSDVPHLQPQVVAFEPHTALFAEDHGNALILAFWQQLKQLVLSRTGDVALIEHDTRQAKTLLKHARILFPSATINAHRDMNGAWRFIEICF